MVIDAFPPVEEATDDGLLAVGGDLEVESLLNAYRNGIFPWPIHSQVLTWFAPPERTILFLDEFRPSRSLRRERRRSRLQFRFNQDFDSVVRGCQELDQRKEQGGTWITTELRLAYNRLHKAGHAHSIEAYEEDRLVGGLYGVAIGGMFAGESMFYRKSNASKLALWFLVEHLQRHQVKWLDCQVMTPLLKTLGAREISRVEFMKLLEIAVAQETVLFP